MKIGIYGGSFDPVHNGHVKLARFMLSALQLDKLLIVPAYRSPFKEDDASHADDRLQMCRLAFEEPCFEVSSVEIDRGGKSFTVQTVDEIKKKYGDQQYYLIVGSDQLLQFRKWYHFSEILSEVTLCAVSRRAEDRKAALEKVADEQLRGCGQVLIFDFDPVEISSTVLRQKLKNGESTDGFLPEKVKRYITDRGLYQ